MVRISDNQIKVIKLLFKLKREIPRKIIIEELKINPTSLQFTIDKLRYRDKPLISVRQNKGVQGNTHLISLTKEGERYGFFYKEQ